MEFIIKVNWVVGENKYMDILDITLTEFNAVTKSVPLYSTQDHVVGENTGLCEQSDGYNCGIFTITTMIMRCHVKQRFAQEKYTKENLQKRRIRLLNLTTDIFRAICPKNKFRYDSNIISVTESDCFSQGWRNNFIFSGKLGYDHKKRFQNMTVDETWLKNKKLKLDKSNSDEGRQITDKDYENDLRHTHVSMGLYNTTKGVGHNQQNFQAFDCYNYPGVQILTRKHVVLNGKIIATVAHIVQLIVNFLRQNPMFRKIGSE